MKVIEQEGGLRYLILLSKEANEYHREWKKKFPALERIIHRQVVVVVVVVVVVCSCFSCVDVYAQSSLRVSGVVKTTGSGFVASMPVP